MAAVKDSVKTQASALEDGKDSVLSQEVSKHPEYLILLRIYVSRGAIGKGRAVLEGVGLDSSKINEIFTNHPLNEEEAVQAGLIKWSRGHVSRPSTWVVLLAAMEYAGIASPHVQHLKNALARALPSSAVPDSDAATCMPSPLIPPALDTADIIEALNHQVDARWRHFGTFLRVDYDTMEAIMARNADNAEDCMLELLGKWTSYQAGTGALPRTWQTVVEAVKKSGFASIADNVAHEHGVTLSR